MHAECHSAPVQESIEDETLLSIPTSSGYFSSLRSLATSQPGSLPIPKLTCSNHRSEVRYEHYVNYLGPVDVNASIMPGTRPVLTAMEYEAHDPTNSPEIGTPNSKAAASASLHDHENRVPTQSETKQPHSESNTRSTSNVTLEREHVLHLSKTDRKHFLLVI